MTKRQIRKLRERIAKFDAYLVQESVGLFGDFSMCHKWRKVMAEDHDHALERYMKTKERQTKETIGISYLQTEKMFARLKVTNIKNGIKKYYF